MYKHTNTYLAASLLLAIGCGDTATTGEGAEIADALELENGGLTMEDEAPAFGEPEAFEDIGEYDAVEDEMDRDPGRSGLRFTLQKVQHASVQDISLFD